jgi:membrane protein YqaA with SNARE-associated domain
MFKRNSICKNLCGDLKGHHLSNQKRGVYGYMWWTSLKIGLLYFAIVIPLVLIGKQFVDLNLLFQFIFDKYSDGFILILFLVSESFLGMIPPDLFMIWTTKFNSPFAILAILGVLSYIGGSVSYLIGSWLSEKPKIKAYTEHVLERYILMVKKWGWAFIVISAIFPFSPYSMVVIAISLLKYPFKLYLLFGVTRIVRFLVQGVFYMNLINMDKLLN